MNLIVVVDDNWAIGCGNKLLYSVPEDMKFFKNTTLGKVVVMGGKTFQSLPFGALKGRKNIILSRNNDINGENVVVCDTLTKLFSELEKYPDENIFIIGGEMFYRTMLFYCDTAHVTKIVAETKGADSFFPNLDNLDHWNISDTSEEQISNGYKLTFNTYTPKYMTRELTKKLWKLLLKHNGFDSKEIPPDIFGIASQDIMSPEKRDELGAHYTSEENILKLINPLFMDELREEFERVKSSQEALERFYEKISGLKFLDPACGCGNFLIVAYKELRLLELDVLKMLKIKGSIRQNDKINLKVNLGQFYGIEIDSELCNLARTVMMIIDQQINLRMYGELGLFLPQVKSAIIKNGNALQMNWETVVPKDELSYILGNPPFSGYSNQSKEQKVDMRSVYLDKEGKPFNNAGKIDYVAAWYYKAAKYSKGTQIKTAFVSTNSITQGEQAAAVFKPLFDIFGINIDFAYRTFKWTNEAKDKAGVHCVIIGFSLGQGEKRIIYDGDKKITAKNINPYLVDAPNIFVERRSKPLCNVPAMFYGSKPVDGGHLLIEKNEYEDFVTNEPQAKKYIKRICGAEEYINNIDRYCLWLIDVEPSELKKMPLVSERIEKVRQLRLNSPKKATRNSAEIPALFQEIRQPTSTYILVPLTTSERRRYIPIGFLDKDTIASNLVSIIPNGTFYHFGILTSSIHMAWVRTVCGRLKSDYRYSGSVVYNNFPWPDATNEQYSEIEKLAQDILNARLVYSQNTLADMYDKRLMSSFPELIKAHENLDCAVMQLYGFQKDTAETSIVASLLQRHNTIISNKENTSKG